MIACADHQEARPRCWFRSTTTRRLLKPDPVRDGATAEATEGLDERASQAALSFRPTRPSRSPWTSTFTLPPSPLAMSLLRSSFRTLAAPRQALAASVRSVSAADGGKVVKQEATTAGEIDPEKQSLDAAKKAGSPLLHSSTSALDCAQTRLSSSD